MSDGALSGEFGFPKSRRVGRARFRVLRPSRATWAGIGEDITSGDDGGRDKKRDNGEQHENNCGKVGGPGSKNAFWQDLTATGGDVEVDEEEGVR